MLLYVHSLTFLPVALAVCVTRDVAAVRATRPRVGGPVPLCIVVDDRLDVWEEDSRKAVLQVRQFADPKAVQRCMPAPHFLFGGFPAAWLLASRRRHEADRHGLLAACTRAQQLALLLCCWPRLDR